MVRVGTCTESSYLFDMSAKTTIWLSPQNRVFVACTSVKITTCSFTPNRRLRLEALRSDVK
jgi:hypothetical protein